MMKHVDEPKLETDLASRFAWLTEFLGFTEADVAALHAAAPVLGPLVPMNALMGFVSDALLSAVRGLGLARETEVRTLRAVNRLLWLQNDLITRHYQQPYAT